MKTLTAGAVLVGFLCQSVVSFGSGQGAPWRKMERSGSWGPATYRENARRQLVGNTYASGERCLSDCVRRTPSPAPDPWSDNAGMTLSVSTPTTSQQFPIPENQEVTLVAEQVFGENIRFKAIELPACQRASLEEALGPQPAKALIGEIQKQSGEGHWDKVIDILDAVYDLDVADLDKATWKAFDALDIVARLRLFEKDPGKSINNPCLLFSTSNVLMNNISWSSGTPVEPIILKTAAIYLYSLGKFLAGWTGPDQYGPVYNVAIEKLQSSVPPNDGSIEWALLAAQEDTASQGIVETEGLCPSM